MDDPGLLLSSFAALIWAITIGLPWQPWRTREVLEVDDNVEGIIDLGDITVVIPARNEAEVIHNTLSALKKQGQGLKVIVVDDESDDETSEIAQQTTLENLTIIRSKPLPKGWTGKLWAQQQGLQEVSTDFTLLLDADIELLPGLIQGLKSKQEVEGVQFVSLMAVLRFSTFWEKLLMPAFIYFFKLIYPFALSNQQGHRMAAAAGGCILVRTEALRQIGGMASIKDAVIDDCTLAKKIKSAGYKTWVGLTHAVVSQRPYIKLSEIWEMVARTAYTQLYYSVWLLLGCTLVMLLMFWLPLIGLIYFQGISQLLSLFSLAIMVIAYLPTLRFYSFSPVWSIAMPAIAGLYLLMTWTSALRYWRGERSRWKGRVYQNV